MISKFARLFHKIIIQIRYCNLTAATVKTSENFNKIYGKWSINAFLNTVIRINPYSNGGDQHKRLLTSRCCIVELVPFGHYFLSRSKIFSNSVTNDSETLLFEFDRE